MDWLKHFDAQNANRGGRLTVLPYKARPAPVTRRSSCLQKMTIGNALRLGGLGLSDQGEFEFDYRSCWSDHFCRWLMGCGMCAVYPLLCRCVGFVSAACQLRRFCGLAWLAGAVFSAMQRYRTTARTEDLY
jgi:hypothetical protein